MHAALPFDFIHQQEEHTHSVLGITRLLVQLPLFDQSETRTLVYPFRMSVRVSKWDSHHLKIKENVLGITSLIRIKVSQPLMSMSIVSKS